MAPKTKFFILFVAIPALAMIAVIVAEKTPPPIDPLGLMRMVVFGTIAEQLISLFAMRKEIYWQGIVWYLVAGVLVVALVFVIMFVLMGGLGLNTSVLGGFVLAGTILPGIVAALGLIELFLIPDQALFIVDPNGK